MTIKIKKRVPIIMVGSMIQQDFSETVSEHGYNLVELSDTGITYNFTDLENPIKYLNFKITDIEDIEEDKEQLLNA
jgi:hypothetical protein